MNVTAYPFRLPESAIMCVYCCDDFPNPVDFKSHMDTEHRFVEIDVIFAHCREGNLKTDCSNLKCRQCSTTLPNLDLAAKHLTDHGLVLEPGGIGLDPFKFKDDKLLCGVCDRNFPCMRQLSKHVAAHYQHFICDACGRSYTTKCSLRQHIKFTHIDGHRICRKCSKTFGSLEAKKKHVESSQTCWSYRCATCLKRFMTWTQKQGHLVEAHGQTKKTHSCPECKEVFATRNKYRRHFATVHNGVFFVCTVCGKKFAAKRYLDQHSVVHSGIKDFQCEVCSKSFSRKDYLTKHVLTHVVAKKLECTICWKQFSHKLRLRNHLKSHESGK